jgi:nitrogen-specific signal transduction histidine kinase/ActR/RegA family two-component response regulator
MEWKSRTDRTAGASVSLDALPFPAALTDRNGGVLAVNVHWSEECEAAYKSQFPAAEFRAVTSGKKTDQTKIIVRDRSRWRCTITPHEGGGLVFLQPIDSLTTEQTEKMETVGRLVGGVAHDFANLITLIGGYAEILMSRVDEKDPLRPELDEIRKAAQRGSRLTGQLLGFTRGRSIEPQVLDLNAIVADMQRMLRPIIGEYVDIRTELSSTLGKVLVDPGQMDQVIMNLILNARDAMPKGGSILIRTENCVLDETGARVRGMRPGPIVTLSIGDTGCGIDSAVAERIWDPFFTTKGLGRGTGLGLSTVRKIVNDSQGSVSLASTPGIGTTFTIYLPCAAQTKFDKQPGAPTMVAGTGDETVLLVEDEDDVRRLLNHVLQKRGYQVIEASNGEQALEVFGNRQSEIDLVLTDMVMPRMSGRELAKRISAIEPNTKVMFMSGYTDDVLVRTGALRPGMSFLQKPLRPEVLAAKVREALDSPVRPFNLG